MQTRFGELITDAIKLTTVARVTDALRQQEKAWKRDWISQDFENTVSSQFYLGTQPRLTETERFNSLMSLSSFMPPQLAPPQMPGADADDEPDVAPHAETRGVWQTEWPLEGREH